ncbi:hypothetical protein AJ78_07724 [Emergomyces pasteurianus Ep9510]|uniref:RING-type E3 ubiquitin transferase n=1 Tax=Emergomyces pasteurianus Ep9510 TaxID=1447872 RepID=A0A1J9Q8L4_9EURO|nr:hypothetical protein AJ78_07724 [Emergomyces pasteurianus Ep9510]
MADRSPPERLFCYQCQSVWARNDREAPLLCPICSSDFVEIVESNGPPPDVLPPRESSPSTGRQRHPSTPPFHPLGGHGWRPGTHTEQFETPNGRATYRTFRSGDGRLTIASTSFRSARVSPLQDQQHPHDIPGNDPFTLLHNTPSLFQALADNGRAGRIQRTGSPRTRSPFSTMHDPHDPHDPDDLGLNIDSDGNMFRLRWRLAPRDAHRAREDADPFAHLEELLGQLPGRHHGNQMDGGINGDVADIRSFMSTLLQNLAFGAGIPDENPDRPITQEQLALLKTQTLKETLQETEGALDRFDGTETCGICMETVDLDSRVTMLPCKHWFHSTCISPWLDDHNTCPHCRARIAAPTSPTQNEGQQRASGPDSGSRSGSGSRSTSSPPGRGSMADPYIISDSPPRPSNSVNGNMPRPPPSPTNPDGANSRFSETEGLRPRSRDDRQTHSNPGSRLWNWFS